MNKFWTRLSTTGYGGMSAETLKAAYEKKMNSDIQRVFPVVETAKQFMALHTPGRRD